jgi:hypothetical protein
MRIVVYDKTNNVEIEDWRQFFKTIIAIETLRPNTQIETNAHIIDQIFENRMELDLPFELKQAITLDDFQEILKLSFITIKHEKFKLRLSIYNGIGKDMNFLIGGILKILAKHSPDYNQYCNYNGSLFNNSIVPEIITNILDCRLNAEVISNQKNTTYTHNDFKLVTTQTSFDFEDIISFYPLKNQ